MKKTMTTEEGNRVSYDEFYQTIGGLNAFVSIIGNWPYVVEYRIRQSGELAGVVKETLSENPDSYTEHSYYLTTKYSMVPSK